MHFADVYRVYQGLKLHFTTPSYDYLKYGPRKISEGACRRYIGILEYLGRKFPKKEDLEQRLIAVFRKQNIWINEIDTEESRMIHNEFKAIHRGLDYHLIKDLDRITNEIPLLEAVSLENRITVPQVIYFWLRGEINIETVVVLDREFDLINKINPILIQEEVLRLQKYKRIFNPDKSEIIKKYVDQ